MSASTAGPKPKQRLPLRLYNGVARVLERLGRRKRPLAECEESFHEAARRAVGWDDFGDPSYLEGLRVLLEAYDREAHLTPFGRMFVEQLVLANLRNRLAAERAWRSDPAILAHEIRRPLFILGLPRTGTTALHHLMGQDPDLQVLEYWLAAAPQPRPPRAEWERRPQYRQATRDLRTMYFLDPSLKAMHLMTADGPEECRHLLQQSFTDDTFDCNATIPSYSEWYAGCDMSKTYARHRDLLKLIGSTTPERRWLLKYPVHMRNLRTLLRTYPDACFVQTHRDPTRVLPSICSLVSGWRAIYEGDVDRRVIAEWQVELWARSMEHGVEVRGELDASRFFDLPFREVATDPLGAVKRIYDHFGLEWTGEAQAQMRRFAEENPPGRHGEHRYAAEDFGLDEGAVAERYAAYMRHFAVERESAA